MLHHVVKFEQQMLHRTIPLFCYDTMQHVIYICNILGKITQIIVSGCKLCYTCVQHYEKQICPPPPIFFL